VARTGYYSPLHYSPLTHHLIEDDIVNEVVIVDGVRTPFSKAGGVLKELPAYELGKFAVRELLERLELPPGGVDQVILGNIGTLRGLWR
jgi:acetyl-CoA acetyltransferase